MDPKKLFFDKRILDYCVFCGFKPNTRDHVPSKVLLDEPYPINLPVVPSCDKCNNSFSIDEPYLACFVECASCDSFDLEQLTRDKIRKILSEKLNLKNDLINCRKTSFNNDVWWQPDEIRVENVLLKLAKGHVAYEYSEIMVDKSSSLIFKAINNAALNDLALFETLPQNSVLPEIGSRAFLKNIGMNNANFWEIVQPNRYRYSVTYSGAMVVRIMLSEYLACEVIWQ